MPDSKPPLDNKQGESELTYVITDRVAWITLNRPERLNAMHPQLCRGACDLLDNARDDPDVRVVVITGAGRAFSAGGDVKRMGDRLDESGQPPAPLPPIAGYRWPGQLMVRLNDFPKPVIAAVNGVAAGAGFELALQADFRIAAETAWLKPAALAIGMVPGDGSVWALPRLVGLAKATEILLTERPIDSGQALRIGLFNEVVPAQDLRAAVTRLAAELADKPPLAIGLTKRALRTAFTQELDQVLEYLVVAMEYTRATGDHAEGVRAFRDKRPANFTGR